MSLIYWINNALYCATFWVESIVILWCHLMHSPLGIQLHLRASPSAFYPLRKEVFGMREKPPECLSGADSEDQLSMVTTQLKVSRQRGVFTFWTMWTYYTITQIELKGNEKNEICIPIKLVLPYIVADSINWYFFPRSLRNLKEPTPVNRAFKFKNLVSGNNHKCAWKFTKVKYWKQSKFPPMDGRWKVTKLCYIMQI